MKYCNAVSVDAISLSKISLLPEPEVKVESPCVVLCLSFKKGSWVKMIQIVNGTAHQTLFSFKFGKATPLFLSLHICISLI